MKNIGEHAPDFELYGVYREDRSMYRLSRELDSDTVVLLLFYPMDFSPVCTAELCSIRDSAWFTDVPELTVWGISADSLYCHREFADKYSLNYPILTDTAAEVAGRYDVKYDWWDGHLDVPKRALFLIDQAQTIQYAWSSDDAYVQPNFDPIEELLPNILDLTSTERDSLDLDTAVDDSPQYEQRLE